jgi:shikimate kinase
MRKLIPIAVVALAVTAAVPATAAAAREYEGTVVSVNRENRTFRLNDCERGTVTIKVNGRTRYERINGFAGLRAGMTNVESIVKRSNGRWVAREVEISGGGGEHGGCDDD